MSLELIYSSPKIFKQNQEGKKEKEGEGKEESEREIVNTGSSHSCYPPQGSGPHGRDNC